MALFGSIKSKLDQAQEKTRPSSSTSKQESARVITFLNQKGGVGKTTMAYHTAYALKEKGLRVLCIDLDPQANLSLLFGVDTEVTGHNHIYHLLINSIRELKHLHQPALWNDVKESAHGVDIIPSGQELSGFELTVAAINLPRQLVLKRFFEKSGILDSYDVVVIDAPPTLGLIVINILCASDGVLVPFRPDEFSRKGLSHLNEVLEDVADMGVSTVPRVLGHIPNLVDLRRKQEGSDLQKIDNGLKDLSHIGKGRLLSPFLNRASLVKCQAQKRSVYDYKSKEFLPLQKQFDEIASLISNWPN